MCTLKFDQYGFRYKFYVDGIFPDKVEMLLREAYNSEEKPSINFFGISQDDPSKLSYLNADRYEKIVSDYNNDYHSLYNLTEVRYHGKPAKVIRKVLGDKLTDQEYQDLNSRFIAKTKPIEWQMLPASDIPKVYNEVTRIDSCMNDCDYFQVYVDHCKGILVQRSEGRLISRALVWSAKVIDTGENITYVDRVYSSQYEIAKQSIGAYCIEKGYFKKTRDSYNDKQGITCPKGVSCEMALAIRIGDVESYEYMPYIDTFTNLSECGEYITNTYTSSGITFDNTDGVNPVNHRILCEDGVRRDPDDCVYVNDRGYYPSDEVCVPIGRDDYYLISDCTYSRHLGDYVYDEDIETASDGAILCPSYDTGDYYYCEYSEEYHHADNMVMTGSNEYVHRDVATYVEEIEQYCITDDCIECEDGNVIPSNWTDYSELTELYFEDEDGRIVLIENTLETV